MKKDTVEWLYNIARDKFYVAYTDCYKSKYNDIYKFISEQGMFSNERISEFLFDMVDDSYQYFMREINNYSGKGILLNVFSGSGRLIKELCDNKLIDKFSLIYNLDKSVNMIEFEKNRLKNEQIRYICEDILNLQYQKIKYDYAVCHCGLRYITFENYSAFIENMCLAKKTILPNVLLQKQIN